MVLKTILIIILSLIALYFVLTFIVSIIMMNIMMYPTCHNIDEILSYEYENKKITEDEFNNYFKFEDFIVKSKYGYNLKASYISKKKDIKFKDNKERVVVLVHGWTSNRYAMLAYGKIYLNLGFHVFIYDHRNHFESDKKITTMGDKEADDLQTVIEEIKKRFNEEIIIGTQGESMGSATVMIHGGRYGNLSFISEDCGYSSLKELLNYQCKELKHLPTFPTMQFANLYFKMKTKSSLNDVCPIKMIKKCKNIPMYFVQGSKDDFVPSYMVYQNYDAKEGFKMIDIYDNSRHACSIVDYPKEYAVNLKKFLVNAKIIDE